MSNTFHHRGQRRNRGWRCRMRSWAVRLYLQRPYRRAMDAELQRALRLVNIEDFAFRINATRHAYDPWV